MSSKGYGHVSSCEESGKVEGSFPTLINSVDRQERKERRKKEKKKGKRERKRKGKREKEKKKDRGVRETEKGEKKKGTTLPFTIFG